MTVGELKEILSTFSEDSEVLLQGSNTSYVDYVMGAGRRDVSAFWGKDFSAVVIRAEGQAGRI